MKQKQECKHYKLSKARKTMPLGEQVTCSQSMNNPLSLQESYTHKTADTLKKCLGSVK